jgi:membrane-bound lytic murein transglycosylase A
MSVKRACFVLASAILVSTFAGCHKPKPQVKDYFRQLPPGELALRKITDPNMIPDFTMACSDTTRLRESVANSIEYLAKPSSKKFFPYGEVTHEQAVETLQVIEAMMDKGMTPEAMNAQIRTDFDCYISVGCDDHGSVLYTGYYTPIFDGSLTKTDKFKYPLYSKPDDLVKGPEGQILGQKGPDGSYKQFPDRKTIESSGMLAGKELVYLADPFEVYIAHVQGSAKIRLPDGKLQTFGYAANNGFEYNSVAQQLIAEKKLTEEQLNLKALIDYFHEHPEEVSRYVDSNPRYVFFQPLEGAPRGCLNEPVTTFRTIATDKGIYPRACLAYVAADMEHPIGWACDQDAGGAIRAAGRCDVYMGIGDGAASLAGATYKEGKLYYIFLKPGAGRNLLPAAPLVPEGNVPANLTGASAVSAPATHKAVQPGTIIEAK